MLALASEIVPPYRAALDTSLVCMAYAPALHVHLSDGTEDLKPFLSHVVSSKVLYIPKPSLSSTSIQPCKVHNQ